MAKFQLKAVSKAPVPSIDGKVVEYNALREQKKTIEDRMKILSDELKDHAEKHGTKDSKGSFYLEVFGYMLGKQCKKSVGFNSEKALAFFKKKKLTKAINIIESINETEVEKYIDEGKLTYEDLENITDTKVSYALDLKKKEEMPEIETSSAKKAIAASSKPTTKLRK